MMSAAHKHVKENRFVNNTTRIMCRSYLAEYYSFFSKYHFLAVQDSSIGDLVTHSLTERLLISAEQSGAEQSRAEQSRAEQTVI